MIGINIIITLLALVLTHKRFEALRVLKLSFIAAASIIILSSVIYFELSSVLSLMPAIASLVLFTNKDRSLYKFAPIVILFLPLQGNFMALAFATCSYLINTNTKSDSALVKIAALASLCVFDDSLISIAAITIFIFMTSLNSFKELLEIDIISLMLLNFNSFKIDTDLSLMLALIGSLLFVLSIQKRTYQKSLILTAVLLAFLESNIDLFTWILLSYLIICLLLEIFEQIAILFPNTKKYMQFNIEQFVLILIGLSASLSFENLSNTIILSIVVLISSFTSFADLRRDKLKINYDLIYFPAILLILAETLLFITAKYIYGFEINVLIPVGIYILLLCSLFFVFVKYPNVVSKISTLITQRGHSFSRLVGFGFKNSREVRVTKYKEVNTPAIIGFEYKSVRMAGLFIVTIYFLFTVIRVVI